MDINRINELSGIIDDANRKIDLIAEKLEDENNTQDPNYLFDMLYMNMDRRTLCQEEITKLKSQC